MTDSKPNLKNHGRDELRDRFLDAGMPPYRADQVLVWLYRRGVDDPQQMTDLPLDLRTRLSQEWASRALEIRSVSTSLDGTRKLLLETEDEELIEAVLIPERDRTTLCVSTQVGCPLACSFCATGAMGFKRNLSTAEIVDQFLHARSLLEGALSITNIVFMGMGEPLLNLPHVLESIRIFTEKRTLAMAPRRITVSTAGLVPKIRPLLESGPINLAISLHATTNAVRDELVPLNRRFPLEELLSALRDDSLISPRRPVFFEYTLMAGVNDTVEDAKRLPELLRGIPCKINVIPMNPHRDASYQPPDPVVCDRFTQTLHRAGMRVTLRRSRGSDIDAACGQLATRKKRDAEVSSG